MKAQSLLTIAALLLVGGCGTSSGTGPTPKASPTLEPGWTIVTDKSEGYVTQLPPTWVAELRDSPKLSADLAAMAGDQAALGAYMTDQLTGTKHPHVKLVAADPASLSGLFITNYNVVKASLGDTASAPKLAEVGRAELSQIKGSAEPSPAPTHKITHAPAGDAYGIVYSLKLSNGQDAAVTTYIILVDQGGKRIKYEITFGTLNFGASAPVFDKVLNRFTVLH
jgi:hypothetical protein